MTIDLTNDEHEVLCKEVSLIIMNSIKPKCIQIEDRFGGEAVAHIMLSTFTGIFSSVIFNISSDLKEQDSIARNVYTHITRTLDFINANPDKTCEH